jgi:tRNA (guanine-N7-)-methyltransferase
MFSDKNFIGVDIKGNRIWRGATTALEENLTNVAFLRTEIDKITNYFNEGEVAEIWITFPDPQLRISKAKKRLTHPKFLRLYQQFLQKGGAVNLKTDSPNLFHFTKGVIDVFTINCVAATDDVYNSIYNSDILNIKTYYETLNIAKSNSIHYLKFTIDNELFKEKDVLLKQIIESAANSYSR